VQYIYIYTKLKSVRYNLSNVISHDTMNSFFISRTIHRAINKIQIGFLSCSFVMVLFNFVKLICLIFHIQKYCGRWIGDSIM
jgi:hypothetical protein